MTKIPNSQPTKAINELVHWLPQLATATSIADVHRLIKEVCANVRNDSDYLLVWNELPDHRFPQPETIMPSADVQLQLATGQVVTFEDTQGRLWTLLPLLHGKLEGWIALPRPQPSDAFLLPLALQVAARLATFGLVLRDVTQLHELRVADSVSDTSIDQLFDELYTTVQTTISAKHMFVAMYDSGSGLLSFAANYVDGKKTPLIRQWTVAQGLTGEVIRRDMTIVTAEYVQTCKEFGIQPIFLQQTPEVHAWLGVPLRYGDRILGLITIYADDSITQYSAEHVRTLEMYAMWIASSLERLRLYKRTFEQARQLELLNELGRTITSTLDLAMVPSLIMTRVQQIMNVEEGSLLLLDQDTQELTFSYSISPYGKRLIGTRISTDVGVAGLVVRTGQSLIVNHAREHPAFFHAIDEITGHETRDMLCVPMIGRDGCKGVIEILNKHDGTPFTPRDRALLEAVADQAVIAIENANLYTRTDQALARRVRELDERNKQLHQILQVGNLVKASSDLKVTLPQVATAVKETTHFKQVAIWLVRKESGTRPALQLVSHVGYTKAIYAEPIPPVHIENMLIPSRRRGESTYYFDASISGGNSPLRLNPLAPADLPEPRVGSWHPDDILITAMRTANGELLGVLTADMPSDGLLPTGEQIQTLEIFTNQLVVALENARLYEQIRQSLQGVTALSALGLAINTQDYAPEDIWQLTVGGLVDSSGALGAGVVLQHGNSDRLNILKIGQSHDSDQMLQDLIHQAMQRRRPIQINASDARFPDAIRDAGGNALFLLPLEAMYGPVGTLYLWYPEVLPDLEEQDLVTLFANQAAVADESKRLAQAVSEGRDRLASILASTEEGIILLNSDLMMVEANAAAQILLEIPEFAMFLDQPFKSLFDTWNTVAQLDSVQSDDLYVALQSVTNGLEAEARGHIQGVGMRPRWYGWTVLPVLSQQAQAPFPSILVLRDITAEMEIEELRQDLTYMIVHDLRGPLASILTSLDMLSKEMMGKVNEGQDKVLRIAMRSCTRLLDMVNMLLDISKMEAGQLQINQSEVDLMEIVHTVLQTFDGIISERKLSANVQFGDALPKAWIDSSTIDRVVQNLVDNAIKYTPTGHTIEIQAHIAHKDILVPNHPPGEWLVVKIRDQGPGIPQHFRERVFEKFAQVQKSGIKGTGLGLTYCRLAVEAHGGRIWVGETKNGKGSTFLFTIPIVSQIEEPTDPLFKTTIET